MSVYDVSQITVSKGIKTRLKLLALANVQKKSGKTDLAEFVANRGYKAVEDALKVGWEMEEAPRELRERIQNPHGNTSSFRPHGMRSRMQ